METTESKQPDADVLLSIENLSVALPGGGDRKYAVHDLSLQLKRGETVCIVGESGSGKSVTAHAVMRLLPPGGLRLESGVIRFDGQDILKMSDAQVRQMRGARISMIFQEPMTALNPVMRVGDQIAEALRVHGVRDRAEQQRRVVDLLADMKLPEPETLQYSYPFQLSGGQRQRVMIAMAMVSRPALLIADEPTTALDVTTQAQILKLLNDLKQRYNMGLLFITHDFGVVADIADRVAVMQAGRLVELGEREKVLQSPEHPYTKKLIAAVPRLRTDAEEVLRQDPLLEIRNVNKTYRPRASKWFGNAERLQVLNGVDLRIHRGEIMGLLGESGSGKTTLGHCVAKLIPIDSGEVRFEGRDITGMDYKAFRPLRPRIQMIFQDPYSSLNPRHRVGRIITENALLNGVPKDVANRRMMEVLELVGLDASAVDRLPHEFSGGQRQRIGIARALVMEPSLIVADEPVSALDVSVQQQVLELLRKVRERYGLSMLFITHDLRIASQICDRIAIMQRGRIVECQTAGDIYRNPQHAYTRELIASMPGRMVESGALADGEAGAVATLSAAAAKGPAGASRQGIGTLAFQGLQGSSSSI